MTGPTMGLTGLPSPFLRWSRGTLPLPACHSGRSPPRVLSATTSSPTRVRGLSRWLARPLLAPPVRQPVLTPPPTCHLPHFRTTAPSQTIPLPQFLALILTSSVPTPPHPPRSPTCRSWRACRPPPSRPPPPPPASTVPPQIVISTRHQFTKTGSHLFARVRRTTLVTKYKIWTWVEATRVTPLHSSPSPPPPPSMVASTSTLATRARMDGQARRTRATTHPPTTHPTTSLCSTALATTWARPNITYRRAIPSLTYPTPTLAWKTTGLGSCSPGTN